MANVTLITVGTLKENYLKEAVAEYIKRISQYAKLDIIELKEERVADEDDKTAVSRALDAEGEKILSIIPKGAYKAALCVEGTQYDSPALASVISSGLDRFGKIVFIIGSSHGLSDSVKRECDVRLSISKLTFPHQLMRPVLLEAVYRSFTIIAGKKYHK